MSTGNISFLLSNLLIFKKNPQLNLMIAAVSEK
jgi:hypothetical protein